MDVFLIGSIHYCCKKFFRNLLLGENNELKNRYMLIGYVGDDTVDAANRETWGCR